MFRGLQGVRHSPVADLGAAAAGAGVAGAGKKDFILDGVCLNWPGQHINRTARLSQVLVRVSLLLSLSLSLSLLLSVSLLLPLPLLQSW